MCLATSRVDVAARDMRPARDGGWRVMRWHRITRLMQGASAYTTKTSHRREKSLVLAPAKEAQTLIATRRLAHHSHSRSKRQRVFALPHRVLDRLTLACKTFSAVCGHKQNATGQVVCDEESRKGEAVRSAYSQ
jgi:hypothetical protein